MYLNKKELDKFIKKNSDPKNVFRDLCKIEKRRTKKNIKSIKRFKPKKHIAIEKIIKMFEHNTLNYSGPFEGFKYKLEPLDNDDQDFVLLKGALGLNSKSDEISKAALKKHLDVQSKKVNCKIYRVRPTGNTKRECQSASLLLLHATKMPNVKGILKEGFRSPTSTGRYGRGIYSTNTLNIAFPYGFSYVNDEGVLKNIHYVFANEVKTNVKEKNTKRLIEGHA